MGESSSSAHRSSARAATKSAARSGAPTISVVIAAFNAEATLGSTLRSVLGQTFRDLEVVVVDDGSTDSTREIAEAARSGDSRVRVIVCERNAGRSAARNRGIDESTGRWVAVMDADDLWFRGRLAALIRAADAYPTATAITDDIMGFTIADSTRPPAAESITLNHRHVTRDSWWVGGMHPMKRDSWFRDRECHMRPIVDREFLLRTGIRYPEHMSSAEDLAFYTQIAFSPEASMTVRVAEPNYYYREGQSTRAANMAESRPRVAAIALENTGSDELRALVDQTLAARMFIARRADQIWAADGRAAARDDGADEVVVVTDRFRGYRQLALNRVFERVGRAADRRLRPQIVADIVEQLRADDTD